MQVKFKPHTEIVGYGYSQGHHGEIFQGVTLQGGKKRPQPVLVTLPCPRYRSTAVYHGLPQQSLQILPSNKTKALRAALHTLALLGVSRLGGWLSIDSNIPVGRGLGSSSADVIAAIRAVANAFGKTLPPQTIARLAVQAEAASDSLMFDDACVLFAQREGVAVERFSAPLPPMDILSIQYISESASIDTIALPLPEYSTQEAVEFAALLNRLRQCVLERDPGQVAAVASASARINQLFLHKPHLEEIECIGRSYGALGVQVAHSGSVIGLLFSKGDREGAISARYELGAYLGSAVELRLFD
ncbi:GHMP family kinase ATP-binding protein [Candidatus Methylospira mobilis]|nr:hypothetical protein [Candidatus Methylospira mobilis]